MAATAWDKLTPNQTCIRASHIQKFRDAITAEFKRRNISISTPFVNDMVNDKPIRAVHVQELRNTLQIVKPAPYSDNPVQANQTVIKAEHFVQIGAVINLLENAPNQGGSSSCNTGCMGLCVSCTGTCTGDCTSCTGCSGNCEGCGGCGGCDSTCSGDCSANCASLCGFCDGYCTYSCSGGCGANCSATNNWE